MKKILIRSLLVAIILSVGTSLWAQRERNYIYVLDCSNSMLGYHLWDPTMNFLEKSIGNLSDNSMVTIIPFQGKVFEKSVLHELKSDLDWSSYKKSIANYPKQLLGTNICEAWDRALNYLDPNKDNYLCLLTDGEDNMNPPDGTAKVCDRIRQWCDIMKNVRGYYVALSTDAADSRIVKAVNDCDHMVFLSTGDDIDIFGEFEQEDLGFNTLDPHDVIVNFSAEGIFPAEASTTDSLLEVSLVEGAIKNGRAKFHFSPKMDLSNLPQSFFVRFRVDSRDVKIVNPELRVLVKNIPERTLQLPFEEINLGDASWYDSFWWSKAKKMDTLTVDLNPQFNESAKQTKAHLKLQFSEKTFDEKGHMTLQQCQLLFNGKPCLDGRIDIDPNQPAVLSIIHNKDSEEGKHYYQLTPVSGSRRNLETINQAPVSDYVLTLRSSYDRKINPLKLAVLVITGILLICFLLWIFVMKPLLYRRISSFNLTISEPYFNSIPIHGALRVVCTSLPKKQSAFDRFFCGKIIYEVNAAWTQEWSLEPLSKGVVLMAPHHYVDPLDSPLEPGTEYKLVDDQDPQNKAIIFVN